VIYQGDTISGTNGSLPTLERRAAVRYHSETLVPCAPVPEAEDDPWSARVQDISTSGIGLVVDRYVEPETLLAVQLQGDELVTSYTVLVEVRNARRQSDDSWHLGCAFARELSHEEVSGLL
jgi:hypothetical protein